MGKNWTEITDPLYICVMSGTNLIIDLFHQPLFLKLSFFIAVFHHILSTKPVWFLITIHHNLHATKITASYFLHCHLSFFIPVTSILGWIVENLVSSLAVLLSPLKPCSKNKKGSVWNKQLRVINRSYDNWLSTYNRH